MNNSSIQFVPSSDSDPLKVVIKLTNIVYPLLLSFASTLGNLLCYAVFSSKIFQNNGSSFFLRTKAIVDILNVYCGTLRFIYTGLTGLDLKVVAKFWCFSISVGVYAIDAFASWLNVFVSVDRLILVFFPIAYKTISKPHLFKTQLGVVLISFASILLINETKLAQLTYRVEAFNKPGSNGTVLVRSCTSTKTYTSDLINVLVTLIIPFVLMAVSSSILAALLIRSNSRFNKFTRGKSTNFSRKNAVIIKTVICLDICFFLFNFPRFVLQFVKDKSSLYTFVLQVSTAFKYSYSSLSVLFYMLANNLFRARVKKILEANFYFPKCS